ncbi:hypothetical protein [Scytonema sp. PCC 10023]|uniref:hypothetical protein n=1 Tax=Scytonema sp. PCC 10023 TaxID=1680591 RepID=UPI0039C69C8B
MTLLHGDWGEGTPGEEGFSVRCATAPTHNFNVARFGLHRFGQGTLLGVYRWLVLSLIAYILAHWAYLSTASTDLPDWGLAAQIAFPACLPQLLLFLILLDLKRKRPFTFSHGIDIQIFRCKI